MWWRRLRRTRPRDPDDFTDEVRAHLEAEEAALREDGLSAEDARHEARRRFGNPTLVRERVYEASRWRWLDALRQDLGFGLRLMRRSPGFAATAVLVLSLGIGVNTALFSIINAVFFRPLPVERPEEIVYFFQTSNDGRFYPFLNPSFAEDLQAEGGDLLDLSSHWGITTTFSVDGETMVLDGEWAPSSYFSLLGIRPVLGRSLSAAEDDLATPELAVVISHDLWTRRFDQSPDVLGTQVRMGEKFFTIIGVGPPGFDGLTDPFTPRDFWVTAPQFTGRVQAEADGPIARMKPGVTFEQVEAFVAARLPLWKERFWQTYGARLRSARPDLVDRERRNLDRSTVGVFRAEDVVDPRDPQHRIIPTAVIVALTGVVGLVLLIAVANIAGLLLARGVTRTGEVAVRRALGAGGRRLARQFLTESVVLASAGGVVGLAIAWNLVALFRAYTPSRFALDVPLDWSVLAFAAVACISTGLMVGFAPALQAARVNVLEALGAGIVGARAARGQLRRWVVVPQIALSLVLLLVAGVHVRSLLTIELTDVGYRTDDAIVLGIGRWEPRPNSAVRARLTPEARRQQDETEARKVREFNRNALEAVARIPGVTHAAIAASLPVRALTEWLNPITTERDEAAGSAFPTRAMKSVVSDGYFDTMGMTLLRGRTFDARDELLRPKVTVISEALERQLGQGRPLIGERIAFASATNGQEPEWLEVVGIVNDVSPILDDGGSLPQAYVPLRQQWRGTARNLIVRGTGDRASLIERAKRAVVGADGFAEVSSVRTMSQVIGEILYPRRLAAALLAVAGLIGLTLACIGLYGVVSFSVSQREREIGIRATLGAGRREIALLILTDGAITAASGSLAGLALGLAALKLTAGLIPGLPVVDLVVFAVVPLLLAVTVLAACWIPARRATRVDPVEALRSL